MGVELESTKPFVAHVRFESIEFNLDLLVADEAETGAELERERDQPAILKI